ncbi:MAG: hypothetical protein JSW71_21475 [Gemmatimonadota bacterium]|nr:MAG: hypothetical protein JSW71_21475 [Gemmatimonadota bacterium]
MRLKLLVCSLLVTGPAVAAAQAVEPGTHVRVSTDRHPPLQGSVTNVSAEWIVIDTVRLPINSITDLQVRHRRSHAGKGALLGGITLGTLTGVGLGVACAGSSGSFIDCSDQVPAAFLIGTSAGFAAGALIGGIIGAFHTSDNWESVPPDRLRVDVMPRPDGAVTVGLSLSF